MPETQEPRDRKSLKIKRLVEAEERAFARGQFYRHREAGKRLGFDRRTSKRES